MTVSSHAAATPKATKPPKTRTGGIGAKNKERKPTQVVTVVNSIGAKSSLTVETTASRRERDT